MAEIEAPATVDKRVVVLTFDAAHEITLTMLESHLQQVDTVLTNLWLVQRDLSELERTDATGLPIIPEKPEWIVMRIRYESPLELVLGFIKTPTNVVNAVVGFLKGIIFYEETRQRLAAEGAKAWEEAGAAHLRNVEKAVRIAKEMSKDDQIDKNILRELLGIQESLPHGSLRLKNVEVRDDK